MHEWTDRLPGGVMSAEDEALEREFEERLLDSSTLAFRVAFSVLRHREDAEDVAQDAFAHAHKRFRQLRRPPRPHLPRIRLRRIPIQTIKSASPRRRSRPASAPSARPSSATSG